MYGLAMRRIFKAFSIEMDTREVAMPVLLSVQQDALKLGAIDKYLNA